MVALADNKALYFSQRLRARIGPHIKQLVLFGSRARGDAREGSDYDFLVVLDRKDQFLRDEILQTETDFMDNFEELSACLIYDESDWETNRKFPIGINILREGIRL